MTYNEKSENWQLLLFQCRYFDKSLSEMFNEGSPTKHSIWVLTSQFDWSSWLLKETIYDKYSKINSSEVEL